MQSYSLIDVKEDKSIDRNVVKMSLDVALAKTNLTPLEAKLVLKVIAQIRLEDDDFKEYKLEVNEYLRKQILDYYYNEERKNRTSKTPHESENFETKAIYFANKLQQKTIVIKKETGFLLTNWFSSFEYNSHEQSIYLCVDKKLKPYLLALKENFIYFKLDSVFQLNSIYSIRLYIFLKYKVRDKNNYIVLDKSNEIPLAILREYVFGVDDTQNKVYKYKEYSDFKKRVLKTAVTELNAKTELMVEHEEIRKNRRVAFIKFKVEERQEKKLKSSEEKVLDFSREVPDSFDEFRVYLAEQFENRVFLNGIDFSHISIDFLNKETCLKVMTINGKVFLRVLNEKSEEIEIDGLTAKKIWKYLFDQRKTLSFGRLKDIKLEEMKKLYLNKFLLQFNDQQVITQQIEVVDVLREENLFRLKIKEDEKVRLSKSALKKEDLMPFKICEFDYKNLIREYKNKKIFLSKSFKRQMKISVSSLLIENIGYSDQMNFYLSYRLEEEGYKIKVNYGFFKENASLLQEVEI